jgi:hypothetical protein
MPQFAQAAIFDLDFLVGVASVKVTHFAPFDLRGWQSGQSRLRPTND